MDFNNKQKEAYSRASAMCSKAEKCSNAVSRKLLDWGMAPDEAMAVLKRLIAEKFIDDERFARSYVRDKFRFNKWGKIKIATMLRVEKIDAAIIELSLAEIDENDYRETLFNLISDKNKSIKTTNQFERKGKLFRFAQSRGFETDLIYERIGELLKS